MPDAANSLSAAVMPLLETAIADYLAATGLPWDVHPIAAFVDANGEVMATTDATTAASSRRIIAAMQAFFGAAWQPGDAAVLNDPDSGSSHPAQISTAVPMWLDESSGDGPNLWAIVRADIPDFGGWELGGYSPQAFDRWAEAGRIVPVKVRLAGTPRREALDTLILNSRTAAITLASVTAMADVATTMSSGFSGLGGFLASLSDHRAAARRADTDAVQSTLAGLAPGRHEGRNELGTLWDGADGGAIRVAIDHVGEALHVTFDDPPAIDARPINSTAAMTEDVVVAAATAALKLGDLHSGAVQASLQVDLPDSTRFAAVVPAAVGIGRETTGQAVFRAVLSAFEAGGLAVDADAAWASYRDRRIGDILDPATGKITPTRAAAITAEEAARTESAA